jgi:hypothetical protein
MGATVRLNGPLFDGKATSAVGDFLKDAEQEVGDYAVNAVQARLSRVLKHPTGHYRSRIQTDRSSNGVGVTDGNVVYGPWLEGVGSRNRRSRFKGYHTFRLVAQEIEHKAAEVAEKQLPKYLGRMQ